LPGYTAGFDWLGRRPRTKSSMPRWRIRLRKTVTLEAKIHVRPRNFPQETVQ